MSTLPDPLHLTRDLGCTRAEFIAWLPGATRRAALRIEGDVVTVTVSGGRVEIVLEEIAPRQIASLRLPVLRVTFRFDGLDAPTRDDFLAYFDRYMQRGGG
jgi:hypothetical protein